MSEQEETGIDGLEIQNTPDTQDAGNTPELPSFEEKPEFKPHPAHEKLLAEIPEAWHQKVIPFLQEQDKAYQSQLEKFTPYKDFIDGGVDPSYIEQSIQLARAISEDPLTIHENLTSALMQQGLLKAQAEEAAADLMSEEGFFDDENDLPDHIKQQFDAQNQQLNEMQEYLYNQQLEQETDYEYARIENEFAGLRDVYSVTPQQETAIIELMEAGLSRGEDLSVIDAAKKLVAITGVGFNRIGGTPQASNAPVVLGAGGGVPFEGVQIPKDEKGKKEMLAKLFEQNQKQSPNSL
jgi:hypothetical protein